MRPSSDPPEGVWLPEHKPGLRLTSSSIILAPGFAGLAGIASLPFVLLLRRPASSSLKLSAYGLPVSVGTAMALDHADHRNVNRWLQDNGVIASERKLWTQDGHLGSDATRVLCAAAGIIAATRCRFPGLSRWQRRIGAACMGAGVGELVQLSSHVLQDSRKALHVRKQPFKLNSDHQMPVRDLLESGWRSVTDGLFQKAPLGPSTTELAKGKSSSGAMAFTPTDDDAAFPHAISVTLNARDGPHTTALGPEDAEPYPQPIPNYDWRLPPDRVIPELNEHISNLRARRARLCTEAQVIWEWLAEKEAEFYQVRDSDTAVGYDSEQRKLHARAYCSALNDKHVFLWMEVSKIDWIIADSLKRIDQHKQFQKGRYEIANKSTSKAELSPLDFALSRFRIETSFLESRIEQHTKTIELIEHDRKDPKMPSMPKGVRQKLQALSKQDREMTFRRLIKEGEEARQEVVVHKAAVEEILKDGEKRAMRVTRED